MISSGTDEQHIAGPLLAPEASVVNGNCGQVLDKKLEAAGILENNEFSIAS
jgi:hypothetical protein